MATTLKSNELQELIDKYRSELRKLEYQKELVQEVIQKLEKKIKRSKKSKPFVSTKANSKKENANPSSKKIGRPKKESTKTNVEKVTPNKLKRESIFYRPSEVEEKQATTKPAAKRGKPKKEVTAPTATPKRRGRPKKEEKQATTKPVTKRGRPKKEVTAPTAIPKRRGRPKKEEKQVTTKPVAKRGRPKKVVAAPTAAPKRRGRPKKEEKQATTKPVAKRGRPKKVVAAPTAAPKRRGRPKKEEKQATTKPVAKRGKSKKVVAGPTAAPKRRGRPKKEEKQVTTKLAAKRGRPKSIKTKNNGGSRKSAIVKARDTSGYRLSEWDNFVLGVLENAGKILKSEELFELAKVKNKDQKLNLTEVEIKGKLTRSIHKLANKRSELVKVPAEGRGYSYALKTWFGPSGLKKKHKK